ncbi:hypothetical protein EXN66_Car017539 [Channa argus]|uniref:Uncharacterized protein n=1 Tax=Channa argus TaxID=215402 RepID=A0A6G1QGQ6_CHAAH|nr:hypothetical protein EXN66_Car017539 [Channa argus]
MKLFKGKKPNGPEEEPAKEAPAFSKKLYFPMHAQTAGITEFEPNRQSQSATIPALRPPVAVQSGVTHAEQRFRGQLEFTLCTMSANTADERMRAVKRAEKREPVGNYGGRSVLRCTFCIRGANHADILVNTWVEQYMLAKVLESAVQGRPADSYKPFDKQPVGSRRHPDSSVYSPALRAQERVFANVCMCGVLGEIALPHRVDILTEKGSGQSEELCKEPDVSVTSIVSHTDD